MSFLTIWGIEMKIEAVLIDMASLRFVARMTNSSKVNDWLCREHPEWSDDHTMNFLFASFSRPRQINPEAHDHKIKFWEALFIEGTSRGLLTDSVFRLPDSETCSILFQRKSIRPIGITFVMVIANLPCYHYFP